jgi:uncharacterized protein YjeT (DUF2065 family)
MADKNIEEVILPKQTVEQNPELARQLAREEAKKSTFGLVIGLICLVAGLVLIYAGVEGSIDWTLKGIGLESKLAKASPGALLFVVGVIIIWITRFSYVVK